MKLGFKKICLIMTIFFIPILIWLFLRFFITDFNGLKEATFILFVILQLVWIALLYLEIKKNKKWRWNVKKIIFIFWRIISIFSPTMIFIILNRFDFFDSSIAWKWIFVITQVIMIIYQIIKGKNEIGENDPYRQDEISEREEK